jgi:endogenous inhibitor of DNA gyrase (YacG/DUF329 family)
VITIREIPNDETNDYKEWLKMNWSKASKCVGYTYGVVSVHPLPRVIVAPVFVKCPSCSNWYYWCQIRYFIIEGSYEYPYERVGYQCPDCGKQFDYVNDAFERLDYIGKWPYGSCDHVF